MSGIRFSLGRARGAKSKFQLEKEAKAAKKRKAEQEAAAAYAEFAASFEEEPDLGTARFVKGGAEGGDAGGGGTAAGSAGASSGEGRGPGGAPPFRRARSGSYDGAAGAPSSSSSASAAAASGARPGGRVGFPFGNSGGHLGGKPSFLGGPRAGRPPPPSIFGGPASGPSSPASPAVPSAPSSSTPSRAGSAATNATATVQSVFGVDDGDDDSEEEAAKAKAAAGKGRQIDALMERMKKRREEAKKPPPLPVIATKGSRDTGDPTTTNLYVGNLAPTVTEELLQRKFGKFGSLISVKIMWPRTDEERARGRNTGFVAFEKRTDAERARLALSDTELEGKILRMHWAKAVRIANKTGTTQNAVLVPAVNMVDQKAAAVMNRRNAANKPAGSSGPIDPVLLGKVPWGGATPFSDRRSSQSKDKPTESAPKRNDLPPEPVVDEMKDSDEKVVVKMPVDRLQKQRLDLLAQYVSKDGQGLELKLIERERSNLDTPFNCLFEPDSDDAHYYRWRVYSLLMGDEVESYRPQPFRMTPKGPWWVPPEPRRERSASASRSLSSRSPSPDHGKSLNSRDASLLRNLLKHLTVRRSQIKGCMGFALDHAECSSDVIEIIVNSLQKDVTPAPVKVARLFLVSDILHNSSANVRNASSYRSGFQESLPDIFESLRRCFLSIKGRITAETMKEKVMSVIRMWERVSLFPPLFVTGLEAAFMRKASYDSQPLPNVQDMTVEAEEELLRKCRLGGVSLKGTPAELQHRLNWVNLYVQQKALALSGLSSDAAAVAASVLVSAGMGSQAGGASFAAFGEGAGTAGGSKPGSLGGVGAGFVAVTLDKPSVGSGFVPVEVGSKAKDTKSSQEEDVDGEDIDGEDIDGEDIDGEDLDGEDLDGEAF